MTQAEFSILSGFAGMLLGMVTALLPLPNNVRFKKLSVGNRWRLALGIAVATPIGLATIGWFIYPLYLHKYWAVPTLIVTMLCYTVGSVFLWCFLDDSKSQDYC